MYRLIRQFHCQHFPMGTFENLLPKGQTFRYFCDSTITHFHPRQERCYVEFCYISENESYIVLFVMTWNTG